jgi:hypothetical protein
MELILIIEVRDVGFLYPKLKEHPNCRKNSNERSKCRDEKINENNCNNCSILLINIMKGLIEFQIGLCLVHIFAFTLKVRIIPKNF